MHIYLYETCLRPNSHSPGVKLSFWGVAIWITHFTCIHSHIRSTDIYTYKYVTAHTYTAQTKRYAALIVRLEVSHLPICVAVWLCGSCCVSLHVNFCLPLCVVTPCNKNFYANAIFLHGVRMTWFLLCVRRVWTGANLSFCDFGIASGMQFTKKELELFVLEATCERNLYVQTAAFCHTYKRLRLHLVIHTNGWHSIWIECLADTRVQQVCRWFLWWWWWDNLSE